MIPCSQEVTPLPWGARVLEGAERPANRRPGQARASANHHCEPRASIAPLHSRCRRNRYCGAEDRGSKGADRR